MEKIKIFSAGLQPTGTVNTDGEYCEYQYCEVVEEEYGEDWNGEVEAYICNLISDIENSEDYAIMDNVTIHNCPENALAVAYKGVPRQIFWTEKDGRGL